jgi:glycine/D-amino acid oxidase-like deaminating enzyme/nitrite reductase/ring-hydroxylating ferredoxin subunit
MNHLHPGESLSYWSDTIDLPKFFPLNQEIEVDVCVVGGGIGGLTTAYLLLKEGKKVCLLEDFEIGSGQTGKTTAHFSNALDDRYYNLEKYHGVDGARLAGESHTAAITQVERIVQHEGIDCDFERVDGFLFTAEKSPEEKKTSEVLADVLAKEWDAVVRAGVPYVEYLFDSPFKNFFKTGPSIRFGQQVQLHPLKYLKALAEIVVRLGGKIYTSTHAMEIHGKMKDSQSATVKTKMGHIVTCQAVVVATNSPVNNLFVLHSKQSSYRSYVMGFRVPKGSIPKGLFWDMEHPYHYLRLAPLANTAAQSLSQTSFQTNSKMSSQTPQQTRYHTPSDLNKIDSNFETLIVGGKDHKTGQEEHADTHLMALEDWTRTHFPMVEDVLYSWSGQVIEPMDGLGFLGHNPMDANNIYVITGDSGNGMTHCTIGAMLITDQIMGRKNPWQDLYSPSRICMQAIPTFIKENANVAAQYTDWLKTIPAPDFEKLHSGEGIVFRHGMHLVAACKDDEGHLSCVSAACPHMTGVVSWNNVEKSWDCPCHGSRFDCHGKVIEGPANDDLKKVNWI